LSISDWNKLKVFTVLANRKSICLDIIPESAVRSLAKVNISEDFGG
jgi:hypothetical protein